MTAPTLIKRVGGEPRVDRPGQKDGPRRAAWKRLLPWAAWIGISWAVLFPILTTAIVADDYLNPFYQFRYTTFSPWEHVQYSWPFDSGHVNFLGTLIGNSLATVAMWLMSVLGLRYSTIYAANKLIVFLAAALATSAFARAGLAAVGRPQPAWPIRAVVSALLFGTLQLHIPWSNDPVGSYPMSGFAAAAVGFFVLSLAVRAVHERRRAWPAAVGLLLALFYYELNAAATVAASVLVCWAVLRHDVRMPALPARVLRYAPIVALPGLVGVALRLRGASKDAIYGGTTVQVEGSSLLPSFLDGLVSGLPASAWGLTRQWLARPVPLRTLPLLAFALALTAIVTVLGRRKDDVVPAVAGRRELPIALIVAVPFVFGAGATLIQSATQKIQLEESGIGNVYNYYAVSACSVAVILGLMFFLVPWSRVPSIVTVGMVVGASLFVLVQLLMTWSVSVRFNEVTLPNQALLVAYSERADRATRCQALTNWAAGPWPDYYEDGMIEGLQFAYVYFVHEPFCPGFERPRP